MKRSSLFPAFLSLVLAPFLLTAQAAAGDHVIATHEPKPNLGQWKTHLIAYHNCQESRGCYTADLNHQADRAISYLRQRTAKATPSDKLALVLDIDETALSNWDEEVQGDFGYIAKDWNDWVDKRSAPAIPATLRLYQEAVKRGVAVFFITGRPTAQESATSENLKSAGYDHLGGIGAAWHPCCNRECCGLQIGGAQKNCGSRLSHHLERRRPEERPDWESPGRSLTQVAKPVLLHSLASVRS